MELYKFLLVAFLLIIIDGIFLWVMSGHFHAVIKQVQHSRMELRPIYAIACYVFMVVVLYKFIIKPRKSPMDAFVLGVCVYGIYETTNLAILKDWLLSTAVIDTMWGGLLFALVTMITQQFIRW